MMLKLCQFLPLIIIYLSIVSSLKTKKSTLPKNPNNENNDENTIESNNNKNIDRKNNIKYKQKLTVIAYGSEKNPASHLISFSKKYNLDFHLIGYDRPWGGFNDKIKGFYNFIKSINNVHNNSIILVLDAYDTVPICSEQDLLNKFNSFNSDIVISTGKDCWPDPNVGEFLIKRLTKKEKKLYKWIPWFLCPNSGAIMGKHDAMLSMFARLQQLVTIGNGSCNDFENNKFSKNTQSDQRCYTTFYVELTKYNEYISLINRNKSYFNKLDAINMENIIDINNINNINNIERSSTEDGSISKKFIHLHFEELHKYYNNLKMKLDYTNSLFSSVGGMMFMDFDYQIDTSVKPQIIQFKSKVTNSSACILHGNGPGVILWRSFIKQIKNNGNLYVDDYVLRVGVDFFHWLLWWLIMPAQRLSHWLSTTFDFDIGFHSTTFTEEVIWRFHVWTFTFVVIIMAIPLLFWYKYKFQKNMKKYKNMKNKNYNNLKTDKKNDKKIRKSNSFLNIKNITNNNTNNAPKGFRQQLVEGLVNLEIMVHHKGNTFPWQLIKPQKKS